MGFKIGFVAAFVVAAVTAAGASRAAARRHGVSVNQLANEVRALVYVRAVLGLAFYVSLFAWLFWPRAFAWSYVDVPLPLRWAALVALAAAVVWLALAYRAMGTNYRGGVGLYDRHELVTSGPYAHVRHPIYAAFVIVMMLMLPLTANWVLAASGLLLVTSIAVVRIPIEERELAQRFTASWTAYRDRTGGVMPRLWPVVVLCCAIATASNAQTRDSTTTLEGRVADATDSAAIGWAEISIVGTELTVRADGRGFFRIAHVPIRSKEFSVRAIGYARLTQSEDFVPGVVVRRDVYMMRVPRMLTSMTIHGRYYRVPRQFEDVYRRGARGWGTFITREQIDSMNPVDVKMLLNLVPGVQTNQRSVYFSKCDAGDVGRLYIDGSLVTRWSDPVDRGDPWHWTEALTSINPLDIQAMEVYTSRGTVPAEFLDKNPCAVVAIWTRRGP